MVTPDAERSGRRLVVCRLPYSPRRPASQHDAIQAAATTTTAAASGTPVGQAAERTRAPLPRSAAFAGEIRATQARTTAAMVQSSAEAGCRISGQLKSVPTADPTR